MFIIVEGPDCAGKTTFVEELDAQLHHRSTIIKTGPPVPPDRDIFEEYEQQLDKKRYPLGVTVADRFHWGEWVYGPLFRPPGRGTEAAWRHIELFLASRGAVVIYLHKPTHELADCLNTRGDDMVNEGHVDRIQAGYRWCVENTILPTISLRMPGTFEASHLATMAIQRILVSSAVGKTSYIGVGRPNVLLFGEKRGGQDPGADVACFVPRPKSCGKFLLEALPEDFWPRAGFANALEDRPQSLWSVLGSPPVVALGRSADKALTESKVPHSTVPHPQWVRRFHHDKRDEYGELIADVVGKEVTKMSPF